MGNCDVIVRKIMDEDKKIILEEAVDVASWTQNTNLNILGFQPLQLVTNKNVMIRGFAMDAMAMDWLYDDNMIRIIMEHNYTMMKEIRELEFSKKLRTASKTRL